MRRFCDHHPIVRRLRLLPLGLLAWLGLAAGSALAQPANDDFANAQDLGNAAIGSVTGDNVNATEENGAEERRQVDQEQGLAPRQGIDGEQAIRAHARSGR